MLPAFERRSGRSRETSGALSSSRTATRCSPTSTETRSSRFAFGSGARRGVSRRRLLPWLRRRSCRCESDLLLADLRSVLRALEVAFASGFSSASAADAAPVEDVFLRPRPPRLPRRRLGLVGSVVSPASSAGGSGITGSGATSTGAGAAASAAETSDLRRRNQGKRKLLVGRHALHLPHRSWGSRERARSCGLKTWP